MQQAAAEALIKDHLEQMDKSYMGVVFDETIMVSLSGAAPVILFYKGPRHMDEVHRSFSDDVRGLKAELARPGYGVGDFEFTRDGEGVAHDAFLMVGDNVYLICNNTQKSTTEITADPKWRGAQRSFVQMAEVFRADPLLA